MVKQILHIILFTTLTLILLSTIAKSQEMTYYRPADAAIMGNDTVDLPEEILEYIYKYDLPAEEKSYEMAFDNLPAIVKNNFIRSKHGSWNVMKVFEVEQEHENIFLVIVERTGYVETLRYNPQGKTVKSVKSF
jgi:hypothetical protein